MLFLLLLLASAVVAREDYDSTSTTQSYTPRKVHPYIAELPEEHQEGVSDLVECILKNERRLFPTRLVPRSAIMKYIFRRTNFNSTIVFPVAFRILKLTKGDHHKCFPESKDPFIVAVGNVGSEMYRRMNRTGEIRQSSFNVVDLLSFYNQICHENLHFPLPCASEVRSIQKELDDDKESYEEMEWKGYQLREDIQQKYKEMELMGAISYIAESLHPGRFCKFDLEKRFNKKVFTPEWTPEDGIIKKCSYKDDENIIFLAQSLL